MLGTEFTDRHAVPVLQRLLVKKTIRKYSCMRRLDFSVFARPAWSLHRLELCYHPWHQVTSDTLTGQENRHGAFIAAR